MAGVGLSLRSGQRGRNIRHQLQSQKFHDVTLVVCCLEETDATFVPFCTFRLVRSEIYQVPWSFGIRCSTSVGGGIPEI